MPTLNSYERVSIEKALITEGKYEFVIKQYTFFFYDDYYFSILVDDNEIVRAVKIQSDNLFKELKTYYTPENYSVYTMPDEVKVEHIKTIMHVPFFGTVVILNSNFGLIFFDSEFETPLNVHCKVIKIDSAYFEFLKLKFDNGYISNSDNEKRSNKIWAEIEQFKNVYSK